MGKIFSAPKYLQMIAEEPIFMCSQNNYILPQLSSAKCSYLKTPEKKYTPESFSEIFNVKLLIPEI